MVVVRGLSLEEVLRRSATVDTVVERELHAVARQVAGQLGQVVVAAQVGQAASPSDVNLIRTLWRELVDKSLLAHVADALFAASRAVSLDFNRILDKVLREQPAWRPPDTRGTDGRRQAPPQRAGQRVYQPPPPAPSETDGNVDLDLPDDSDDFHLDPLDEDQATEVILSNSRNRLVDIGDEFWEHARDELVLGINEGESVDKLAARVRDAADVTLPRARTIARTEVIGACNAGSMLTMRSVDLATAKVWLATPDTRTRLDHRLAQGQTVPLDAPFVVGGVPLDHPGDAAGPPEQVINCLVEDTQVSWTGQNILNTTRRRYTGTLIQLVTARGHVLTVTPNHPVLTGQGYVAAHLLTPGDEVIATTAPVGSDPEVTDVPTRVDELHGALRESGQVSRVIGSRVDFHGDGANNEVEVVWTDGHLREVADTERVTHGSEPELVRVAGTEGALAGGGGAEVTLTHVDDPVGWRAAGPGGIGASSERPALVEAESLHAYRVRLTATSSLELELFQPTVDQWAAGVEFLRHTKDALTLGMSSCELVQVNVLAGTHDVYNLSTTDQWYTANGIACHNCRCTQVFDVEELPTPEGEEDSDDIEGFDPSLFPDVEFTTGGDSTMISHNTQALSAPTGVRRGGIFSVSSSPAEVTVPWHIERNHSDCDPKQWAVVQSDEDTVEGCFDDRADAVAKLTELAEGERDPEDDTETDLAAEPDDEERQCPPGQRWDDEAEECVPGEGEQETASTRRSRTLASQTKSKPRGKKLTAAADGDECPPGHHTDEESGECVPDEELSGNVDVQGVAVVEGTWTGDGRQFALGALAWPDPEETNLALQWQKETSHGGVNDNTVNVGWLTSLERDGDRILVTATIDTDSADGAELARGLAKRGRFGVSIVADNPDDSEIEFVYPEECDAALEDSDESVDDIPMACFMPKAIFHSGRIRALTIVDVPAFVEAYIEPVGDTESLRASGQTYGAVAAHDTATSDSDWDSAAQEKRLGDEVTLTAARAMYAWIDEDAADGDNVPKSACKFPHHEVSDDGTPGAANLTACSAGIGALNGARGGADIPAGDKQGVYDHLAAHLRDADQEPPPPSFVLKAAIAPLIAAAHQITLSDTPPAEWFQEPVDLPEVGAIAVTDEGRVYGLLAPRHVAHRSFEKRVTVPTGNVDYSRWMNRQTIVAGGQRVTTGPITMGCGHAGTDPWVSADASMDHYDNSCSVVATVRIGENRHGVWIAGALLPDVTPHQVARMLACQLSGDWRPHPEQPGKRELTGALLVPVPGFPVAASASVRLDHGQLVAAAAPVQWQSSSTATVSEVRREPQPRPVATQREASQPLASEGLPSWEDVQRRRQNRLELQELSAKIGIEA